MIDLRSDTVTRPTAAMRAVMAAAPVGDDVWGDDPSVNALEQQAAERLGKEAALFVASGTQANLIALLSHCQRGDEFLVGQLGHIYRYEGGGAAVLGGLQPQPLPQDSHGGIALETLAAAQKPDDVHFPRTRLLCLENTFYGRVLPQDYVLAATAWAAQQGLRRHLDGARIFNSAIKQECPVQELTAPFDSVSVCLSKGLGAPVGSVLCGTSAFITQARRWRKMLGGGMRQAGILAAAGLYALEHHVERLREDHAHAALLAAELAQITGLDVLPGSGDTNMVFVLPPVDTAPALVQHLQQRGILVDPGTTLRLVTHLDVDRAAVLEAVAVIKAFYTT